MFWADEIADDIIKTYPDQEEFVVRDEKTLSGPVHVGSLRGVVIHGIIAQVLNEKGKKARFLFEFNDFDPMDGMPKDLEGKGFDEHMGKPLYTVPSPDGKAENFAEYYGKEFHDVIKEMGFDPEIPRAKEAYRSGKMNKWMVRVLKNSKKIRDIYKEVSGSIKDETWNALQMVCQNCGKVGTTKVISWNEDIEDPKVNYRCYKDLVSWAEGCDKRFEDVSPFNGVGKLPWKLEWPAKWDVYNVTVEGSGKDHNAAGGSHDIGEKICKEVSNTKVPFNIPYEFFLIGGKKMSASKGVGQSARDIADQVPPEMLRFLMLSKKPNQPIEFDPEGDTIPRLFDLHDQAAGFYFMKEEKDTMQTDRARLFELSQTSDDKPVERFLPRFSQLVFIIQIPRLDVYESVAQMKGSALTDEDKKEVDMRVKYAKKWLQTFAPDKYRFELQESMPSVELSDLQKQFATDLAAKLGEIAWDGQHIHTSIHDLVKASDELQPKDAFQTIYRLFLAKDSGPQAGWFLGALEKDFVLDRLKEAA